MDLVATTYRLTEGFPKDEAYGLSSQLRRAAVSIPSNIAEGHTRAHRKEYLQHISLAQASLAELETQVEIAARLNYLTAQEKNQILEQASLLGRSLYALRNALQRKSLSPGP